MKMAAKGDQMDILDETDSDEELPPGWEERATLDGDVFYVNHITKSTHWNHPLTGKKKQLAPELPYGWEMNQDDNGIVIFKDTINNRTTYTDPRLAFAEEISPRRHEFKQRFDGKTTGLQVVLGRDFRGKFAIVTGGNSGIGFETVRSLALHGCHVVIASRDLGRCEEAANAIRQQHPEARLFCMRIDLADLASVRSFAREYLSLGWSLNYLILNAGIFGPPHTITKDGIELCFQVNHVGHHLLTSLLMSALTACPSPRVVVVSSESHRMPSFSASDFCEAKLNPLHERDYNSLKHYGTTKLCNIWFARQLHLRFNVSNGLLSFACHPGNMINTQIGRNWWFYKLLFYLAKPFTKSLQQGAATSLYCAVHKDMEAMSGSYLNNCCLCPPSSLACDDNLGEKLWEITEELIKKASIDA